MKYWLTSIATDAAMLALFLLWKIHGIAGAGNALGFFIWFIVILRLGTAWVGDKTMFEEERPRGFPLYHGITELVAIGIMAWLGMFWLAGLYLFATIGNEAARQREPKDQGAPA